MPQRLFQFDRRVYGDNPNVPSYDVASDGRFLVITRQQSDAEGNQIRAIVNWQEELKQRDKALRSHA